MRLFRCTVHVHFSLWLVLCYAVQSPDVRAAGGQAAHAAVPGPHGRPFRPQQPAYSSGPSGLPSPSRPRPGRRPSDGTLTYCCFSLSISFLPFLRTFFSCSVLSCDLSRRVSCSPGSLPALFLFLLSSCFVSSSCVPVCCCRSCYCSSLLIFSSRCFLRRPSIPTTENNSPFCKHCRQYIHWLVQSRVENLMDFEA